MKVHMTVTVEVDPSVWKAVHNGSSHHPKCGNEVSSAVNRAVCGAYALTMVDADVRISTDRIEQ